MSIESLLEQLVTQVKGATGAIILEMDGEAVRWYSLAEEERLKLRGAYAAVEFKARMAASSRARIGNLRRLILEYEYSSLIVHEIDEDCLVVVELALSANIGRALFCLEPIVRELRSELTGLESSDTNSPKLDRG